MIFFGAPLWQLGGLLGVLAYLLFFMTVYPVTIFTLDWFADGMDMFMGLDKIREED